MFVRKPGKGITLEMYIRNTQVNKKKKKKKKKKKELPNVLYRVMGQICYLEECSYNLMAYGCHNSSLFKWYWAMFVSIHILGHMYKHRILSAPLN